MRTVLLLTILGLGGGAGAWAQKTRVEVVKPTTPEDDARPNNPEVPEGIALSAEFERIVIFRFKFQTDLLAGIEKLLKQEKIRNAVILSGVGSVRNYHIHSVSNRDFPSKNIYTKDPTQPADIVSVNGFVMDGRVHAHLTMADTEKAFGGHLEPETHVFTFAIVTLGVLPDHLDLRWLDDKTRR
jgi:predicted DNA-binding protein with PD1-like motif